MRTDGHVAKVLAALSPYDIVGTEPEAAFDIFPELACAAFAASVAVLTFFDGDRLWIKAEAGPQLFDPATMEGPLRETFDVQRSLVIAEAPNFYCGAPIRTPDGVTIGVLGVFGERSRLALPAPNPLIDIMAECVTLALESRRRAQHPKSARSAVHRNLFAVTTHRASTFDEHSIDAVLSKIQAGRLLLRTDEEQLHDAAAADTFVSAMRQLLSEDGHPHVLVMFAAYGSAATELVAQARRARLLCDVDLVAVIDGMYVTMLLRDMPVAIGNQAVKRFARAQLNTSFSTIAVRGPLIDARALFDDAIANLGRPD